MFLLPVSMIVRRRSSLVILYFGRLRDGLGRVPRAVDLSALTYVFITAFALMIDRETARRSLAPGHPVPRPRSALVIIIAACFPGCAG